MNNEMQNEGKVLGSSKMLGAPLMLLAQSGEPVDNDRVKYFSTEDCVFY